MNHSPIVPTFASRQRRRRLGFAGFSLVEVVLALGVMSFALTAIVGMLPVGLSHFRKAMDLTVQAQIAQELTSKIQRTSFADIDSFGVGAPSLFYYNEDGTPSDKESVYSVTTHVFSGTNLNGKLSPVWSVDQNTGIAMNNVKAVQIVITNRLYPDNAQSSTTYVANDGL